MKTHSQYVDFLERVEDRLNALAHRFPFLSWEEAHYERAWILIRRVQYGLPPLALILLLSTLTLAQQPQPLQIVSNCVKGIYDACDFVPPHWYYLKNGIWTRDDGLVGKPPAVTVVPCPADSVTKLQPVQPKIIAGVSGLRLNKSNDSSWNVHFWTSSAVFFGGSFADWASSRGRRELGPLRNSTGGLNSGVYWSLNGGLYTLSVIIQKRHPKGASVIRYVVGAVHFGDAAWNWSTR